jgi:hypothetical protein
MRRGGYGGYSNRFPGYGSYGRIGSFGRHNYIHDFTEQSSIPLELELDSISSDRAPPKLILGIYNFSGD